MMYLIALACPPLAVLLVGKPGQALINLALCCFFLIPGWIHALGVVGNYYADRRTYRLMKALRTGRR